MRKILQGDVHTVAQTLTQVENPDDHNVTELLKELFPHTGKSFVIGVTGSAGSGKSTLIDQLACRYKKLVEKVGILAVDPTSSFTGGALLGDRIRMQSVSTEPGFFIRSMATRGKMGGLSAAVSDALLVFDAAGYEIIMVETVGVGQDEIDIAKTAHVTVIVLVPGMGDEIQTIKAGLMEIGDVFVINKADHEGASRAQRELEVLFSMGSRKDGWNPPVIQSVARQGQGLDELVVAIQTYRDFLAQAPDNHQREVSWFRQRLVEMLRDRLTRYIAQKVSEEELNRYAEKMVTRELDPYTIIDHLLKTIGVEEGTND